MAELILTPEEEAAASYKDFDDASLGRAVKFCMFEIDDIRRDLQGKTGLYFAAASGMLVNICLDSNAAELKTTLVGLTTKGVSNGDWEVIVRRVKAPADRKEVEHG